MLTTENAVLLVVDVQEKLLPLIDGHAKLLDNIVRLTRGMKALGVPIVWTEHYPKGLGPTVQAVSCLLAGSKPVEKVTFSCCSTEAFNTELASHRRSRAVICGIESHICVYQTAAELLARGMAVDVAVDAVGSRTEYNRLLGIEKIRDLGGDVTSVECSLFEILRVAGTPSFREIYSIIK